MRHIATAGRRGPAGKQFVSVDLQRRTATPSGETIMPTAPLMSSQRRFLQIIAKNAAGVQQLLHPNVSPRLQGSQTPENTKGFSESKPCDTTCDQILSLLLAGRRRRWDRTPPTSLR